MYIDKQLVRGYNQYINSDDNNGEGSMMDVAMLVMEPGDSYTFSEPMKEVAWILFAGKMTVCYSEETIEIERANPFDYNPWCLHICAGDTCTLTAQEYCEVFVQKTHNDNKFPAHLYSPQETNTWHRGADGECGGCIKRDVRTCFDYSNAPYSNMVLGEVVNLGGKWSSYPPHDHPQPEVYYYYFEKPQGFGAGWVDDEVVELHHHGLAVITKGTHSMVMAPGYPCCYAWGIRHLPGNPWDKTRIDDPAHDWLLDPNAEYWNSGDK